MSNVIHLGFEGEASPSDSRFRSNQFGTEPKQAEEVLE